MYNANIKDKNMLMDLYQDQLEELEDAKYFINIS